MGLPAICGGGPWRRIVEPTQREFARHGGAINAGDRLNIANRFAPKSRHLGADPVAVLRAGKGDPGAGVPSGPSFATRPLPLPVIQTLPAASMAMPDGSRISTSKVRARCGSPRGNCVTLAPPLLAIQILPQASDRMPRGFRIRRFLIPAAGGSEFPRASNREIS